MRKGKGGARGVGCAVSPKIKLTQEKQYDAAWKRVWNYLVAAGCWTWMITHLCHDLIRCTHNYTLNPLQTCYKTIISETPARHRHPKNLWDDGIQSAASPWVGQAITLRKNISMMKNKTKRNNKTSMCNVSSILHNVGTLYTDTKWKTSHGVCICV